MENQARYQLKNNEAAIVFSPDGMWGVCPDMDDDAIVPDHIISAMCSYILLSRKEYLKKIQYLLDEIGDSFAANVGDE